MSLSGCITTRPPSDITPPTITVIVSQGRGGNIFLSDEDNTESNACINVPGFPTEIGVIASDPGGVDNVLIQTTDGSIAPGSVLTAPIGA